MAIPTKKIYGRNGKLMFDPNNPEDVRNYKEKQSLMEALKLVQGLTDPRGGGGLVGMARKAASKVVSKAIAKETVKKVTRKSNKKATPTVKEIVETKPNIPTTIPSTMELAQIPGSSVKTIKEGIKSFKGTKGKFTPRDTERVAKAREILNQPIAGTMRPSTISQGVKNPFVNTSVRPYVNTKGNPFDFNKFKLDGDVINKPLGNVIEGAALVGKGALVAGGLGVGSALFSSDSRISSPVDLKRIDKNKLRDSNIEGVKTIRGSDGKDYGIKWDNTTKSWDYYRGSGVKPIIPKPKIVKDSDVTSIDNNNQNKGTGTGSGNNQKTTTGGGGTKTPVKPTVTPTTSTYVGDEYYKANPDLEKAIQEDSIRQQREMYLEKIATKPLSSIVFKPTSKAVDVRNVMDEQDALRSIRADNKLPLKKKKYGGNLAMLKYMK